MGKFPFIVEHVAFAKRESFCLNSYKIGKIPIKMGKFLKKMGKFPFIVEHVDFAKRSSFLEIPIKSGKFP